MTSISINYYEREIQKHLYFFCVFGGEKFTPEMFNDLSTKVEKLSKITASEHYIGQVQSIKRMSDKYAYAPGLKDFFEPTQSSSPREKTKKISPIKVLTNVNRFRGEFAAIINMLNHIYLLKALIEDNQAPKDSFLILKVIEQYALSAGALCLVLIRLLITLNELNQSSDYEYQKKLQQYKYTIIMDCFMLPVHIINLAFVITQKTDFLPIIGMISFGFEMIIGFIRYHEIKQNQQEFLISTINKLSNTMDFKRQYLACKTYEEQISLLKKNLLDKHISESDRSIYLSLIIDAQKTELELRKIKYNSLVCAAILAIFVVFEQLIFQQYLVATLNPAIALIITLSIIYVSYLLKNLVVDKLVPYTLDDPIEVNDAHIVHGQIKSSKGHVKEHPFSVYASLIRVLLPLTSFALLQFLSLELTIACMLFLCLAQSFVGVDLNEEPEMLGESFEEMLEHTTEPPESTPHS